MSLVSHHWPVHLPFPRKLRGPPKLHKLLRSLIRFSPTLSQTTSPCRRLGLNLDLQVDIPNPAPEAHIYTCLPVATPRALRLPLSSVPSSKSTHTPPGPPSLRDSVALQSQGVLIGLCNFSLSFPRSFTAFISFSEAHKVSYSVSLSQIQLLFSGGSEIQEKAGWESLHLGMMLGVEEDQG